MIDPKTKTCKKFPGRCQQSNYITVSQSDNRRFKGFGPVSSSGKPRRVKSRRILDLLPYDEQELRTKALAILEEHGIALGAVAGKGLQEKGPGVLKIDLNLKCGSDLKTFRAEWIPKREFKRLTSTVSQWLLEQIDRCASGQESFLVFFQSAGWIDGLEFHPPLPPSQCFAIVENRESEFDLIELGGDE